MTTQPNETPRIEATCTLNSGAVVHFDVPDTTQEDTSESNPVRFWLEVMPTANETDPD